MSIEFSRQAQDRFFDQDRQPDILIESFAASPATDDQTVVELFPRSYVLDSERFNRDITSKYSKLHRIEDARKLAFLRACDYIEYPTQENIVNTDKECEIESEKAWRRNFVFTDGSVLTGRELQFVDDDMDQQHIDQRKLTESPELTNDASSINGENLAYNYNKQLIERYKKELEAYRLELHELSSRDLDKYEVPTNEEIKINTSEMLLSDRVLNELAELFKEADEHEAILQAELERIAKEEKRQKRANIIKFLSDNLEDN
jgi:hypothetical protein